MQGSESVDRIIQLLLKEVKQAQGQPRHIVIMSNGGFDGIHKKLIEALQAQHEAA